MLKKRLSQKAKKIKRIRRWDKFVLAVKWLIVHHVFQDIIALIIWLVDKLLPQIK